MVTESPPSRNGRTSRVVKVTGVSDDLLALLDARVRQQRAGGRAAYLRELIRRDVLTGTTSAVPPSGADPRLAEYHLLTDAELRGEATPTQVKRLHRIEQQLDEAEAGSVESQEAVRRQDEVSAKLDRLLALVQGLPRADG